MRVKFHIPKNARSLRDAEINQGTQEAPTEPPKFSSRARSTKTTRYQRGGTKSNRYNSAEGSEGLPARRHGAEPKVKFAGRLGKKTFVKKPKNFVRTRKIETRKLMPENSDFGPFNEIVSMSSEGIDISDINQAKKLLKSSGLVPMTFKFFVDTVELRNRKITSAEISFEKPSGPSNLPSYTGTIIDPMIMNLEFQKAGNIRKRRVLEKMYVNFENIYDLTEDIEYKITMSPTRLSFIDQIADLDLASFKKTTVKEPIQIPMSPSKVITNYVDQYRNFSLGKSPDPGSQINLSPGSTPQTPGFLLNRISGGTSNFLSVNNLGSYASSPTGTGLLDNKMSDASMSLVKVLGENRVKKSMSFKSRLMPVVVNVALPALKFTSNIQVRIRLKSSNALSDQVIAAGSKIYQVDKKYRACLLPIEPPIIRVTPLGTGKFEISSEQQDPAGTHVTIFGKFFDSNGISYGPWQKLKTFKCKKQTLTVMDFARRNFASVCLRAVATNGVGLGSKYSAATVKNFRPPSGFDGHSIVGNQKHMPIVVAAIAGTAARLHLRNCENCTSLTIIREDLSTGSINRVATITNDGKSTFLSRDRSVRFGATYRYFVVYKTVLTRETELISYKDAIYTHREISPEAEGISIGTVRSSTTVGDKLATSDDAVTIQARLKVNQRGMKKIVKMMSDAGIDGLVSSDVTKTLQNFDKFFATRTTRINVVTGKREILGMVPLNPDRQMFDIVDSPASRRNAVDANMTGPIPGSKYMYVTRLYYADIQSLLGRDTGSELEPQNPFLSQTVLKVPGKRFFITANTLRSILPSEEFVSNDANFGNPDAAYERNFTGVEIVTTVDIPESNNFIRNVSVEKITDEVMTLTWDYGGSGEEVDHFVVCEKSLGKIVPIGAKIAFTTTGKHTFHISGHDLDYDKTYMIKAYNDQGAVVAEGESNVFVPSSPIPNDILKIHSFKSLQSLESIKNVSF